MTPRVFSPSIEIMASVNFFTTSCLWASENTPSITLASSLRVHTGTCGIPLGRLAPRLLGDADDDGGGDRPYAGCHPDCARELEELERESIIAALESAGERVAGANGAAERLGTKRLTLRSRMKAFGIGRPG